MQTEPISKITNVKKDKAYASENLDIHIFCSILYKFIEANQDKKGGKI